MSLSMADFIDKHFDGLDLDLRKSRFGRFMDQKLTQDNLSFIADCILNLTSGDTSRSFTTRDLWDSEYFCSNVMTIYNKPDPKNQAENEYDKFINQPLRLLSYAQVLSDELVGGKYIYTINSLQILEYIALNQLNALRFLDKYLTKVLSDSGEIGRFNTFNDKYRSGTLSNEDLVALRDRYATFIRGNTAIKGEYEPNRIFNKVLNILAAGRRMPGARGGRVTKFPIIYKDLEYNVVNWRDVKKQKDIPRKEVEAMLFREKLGDYEMKKAKKAIKDRYAGISEINDSLATGKATQVHHIFPDSVFPKYRASLENLILLTASQHNSRAHPNNNTQVIDPEYQRICLLAKADNIQESLNQQDGFYSLESFIDMLNELKDLNISVDATINHVKDRLTSY